MLTQNPALRRTLRNWAPPVLLILFCAVLQFCDMVLLLRYQRDMIEAGQVWRILSGNLIHLGWSHWLLNAVGLLVIWMLLEPALRNYRSILMLGLCCLMVGLGLYFLSIKVNWYVGLSGALHGLLIVGLLKQMKQQPGFSTVILALLVAKLLWEQFVGPLPGSERSAGGPVLVIAHAYGAIAGVLVVLSGKAIALVRG